MPHSINQHTVVGNLGQDPTMRSTADGKPVASFTVATNVRWTKNGERQERTDWHNVVAFGKIAETAQKYLRAGSLVYIQGENRTAQWEHEGQTHYRARIYCRQLCILSPKDKDAPQDIDPDEQPEFDADLADEQT